MEGLIDQLLADLPEGAGWELILVNDGSTDRTRERCEDCTAVDPRVRVVHHEWNRGYGAALKTGIRWAHSDLIVITDADGTYPNERIPELVDICVDADMVVGARVGDGVTYPLIRKIPKLFLVNWASWLVGRRIPDMNSGLRVFRKPVAKRFLRILPDSFSFTTTITICMMRNHYRVVYVPIGYEPRIGQSKIKPIRDTLRFTQLILRTGMYFAPIRLLTPLIAALCFLAASSLFYDVWFLGNLTDKTVMLFVASMNLVIFALLADMIDKRSG